jgi:hypothetical protein
VTLDLRTPFLNKRAVKPKLKETILNLVSRHSAESLKTNIFDNFITVTLSPYEGPGYICGLVSQSALPAMIFITNACCILEERIAAKAKQCGSLESSRPLWLALLNRYPLAEIETYHQAMEKIAIDHPFKKILFVSRDSSVNVLFENNH